MNSSALVKRMTCTVKTEGSCSGALCALHKVCPYEREILEEGKEAEDES